MVDKRLLQNLISLIETEYQENNHTSFANAVWSSSNQQYISNRQLHDNLKSKYGISGGNISKVVGKRMYSYVLATEKSICQIIADCAEKNNCRPNELPDRELVRCIS